MDDNLAVGIVRSEEVLHHCEGLCACDDAGLLVEIHEGRDICGVVGLHVLDDEIVRSLVSEDLVDVVKPLVCEMLIHGVEDRALRVENRV